MRFCGLILGLSLLALFLRATVFGLVIMGPIGFIAGPVLAIFGWFYLVPILLLVSLAWAIVDHPMFRGRGVYLFVALAAAAGSLSMALLGVKEIGQVARYTIAYVVGGAVSGAIVASALAWLHRLAELEPPTPPAR